MTLFNILDSANIQWIWEIRKKTQENLRIEQHNDMHDELLAQQRCNYAIVGVLNVRKGSCVNQDVFYVKYDFRTSDCNWKHRVKRRIRQSVIQILNFLNFVILAKNPFNHLSYWRKNQQTNINWIALDLFKILFELPCEYYVLLHAHRELHSIWLINNPFIHPSYWRKNQPTSQW